MTDTLITDTTHLSLRVWLRLLTCTHMIETEIRGRLREEFSTTLPRFDVLAQLYRYPDGLRMGALSKLLMVSGGNVTGIVDQLVGEELVERLQDPQDRRAYVVRLTAQGRVSFVEMAEAHHGWIAGLFDELIVDEQEEVLSLLKKLRVSLEKKVAM